MAWDSFDLRGLPSVWAICASFFAAVATAARTTLAVTSFCQSRKLWGSLFVDCRHVATLGVLWLPAESKRRFCALVAALPVGLKRRLRNETSLLLEVADVLGPQDRSAMANSPHQAWHALDELMTYAPEAPVLVPALKSLGDVVGALDVLGERTTPDVVVHLSRLAGVVALFAVGLTAATWPQRICVAVFAFVVVAFDHVADEIEAPFGHHKRHLPLGHYCDTLKHTIRRILQDHHHHHHQNYSQDTTLDVVIDDGPDAAAADYCRPHHYTRRSDDDDDDSDDDTTTTTTKDKRKRRTWGGLDAAADDVPRRSVKSSVRRPETTKEDVCWTI